LIATGSEVELAMSAAEQLADKGTQVRVVSMPCAEIFSAQDKAYRESVLPQQLERELQWKPCMQTTGISLSASTVALLV